MGGYLDLYLEPRIPSFLGFPRDTSRSKAVIMGIPYDSSSTCKPGCRYAPQRLRNVSHNLETYDPVQRVDVAELPVSDIGDVREFLNPHSMVDVVSRISCELNCAGKTVVGFGGDHTVTLGLVDGLRRGVSLVMFDAHLDYRNEYPIGEKISHATVLRRLREGLAKEAIVIGVRALSKEEILDLERESNVQVVYPWASEKEINDSLSTLNEDRYVTIDIDVLDPSAAPGVGCPEPGGFTFHQLLSILDRVFDGKVLGIDVVEVNPLVDINDITSYLAAKLVMKILSLFFA